MDGSINLHNTVYCINNMAGRSHFLRHKSNGKSKDWTHLPRFHVAFWLSYILVYLFYF